MSETNRNRPKQTMRDVSHTPPSGESVTNVWQRGHAEERAED
ncbi:hypothetical protein ACFQJC_09200 [Haloferax namakaokahaiae]|uniref:Uncharacterized protein n=1 Tax=Haloferax namakaokahaiae TaxID=1748331 RepID=A0ABD5ZER8_9EURY